MQWLEAFNDAGLSRQSILKPHAVIIEEEKSGLNMIASLIEKSGVEIRALANMDPKVK